MDDLEYYRGREQSLIKHEVLKKYLQRLTYKIVLGLKKSHYTLTYIDGFSGPWQSRSENFSDTSFQIAINELRAAREALARDFQIKLDLRCLFVEKDPQAYRQLEKHFKDTFDIELELINGEFEQNIPRALHFAQSSGNLFTFVFIDPTGWTGFGLNAISPLLRLHYSEVLINFMTKDIIRFIDDHRQEIKATFRDLFGTDEAQKIWSGLEGREREGLIVDAYRRRLKEAAGFKYVADSIILHPGKDRTHFNLIYGTRNLAGLQVFRESEQKAMEKQNQIRNISKQERRIESTNNLELFSGEEVGSTDYYDELRNQYTEKSCNAIKSFLKQEKRVQFSNLLSFLEFPMTYESDIQEYLTAWKRENLIEVVGMSPRERVIKKNHSIIWKGNHDE